MSRRVNLVAVQARMELADYRDAAAFRAKIAALMNDVSQKVDLALPTLVSFPELIGMFLSYVPRYWDVVSAAESLEAGTRQLLAGRAASMPDDEREKPRLAVRRMLYIEGALKAEAIYVDTFASLAREHRCYVAAGSIAVPPIDIEPSKGGRHIVDDSKLYNTAYLFSSRGVCLSRTPKIEMTRGFEERVFDSGSPADLVPVDTALGRIGTLVCFDGFHQTLVERYDAQGVEILLKPSFNQAAWNAPSSYDPTQSEGNAWLAKGCPAIIQGRENIRYGVNAMLVGSVFPDTFAEGLSTIARNTGDPNASWRDGLLAIASDPGVEEIISATVEL